MKITVVMVATYMFDCVLVGTKPCKYFQLNSPWFNKEKGIFSKIELDQLVPERWRLAQRYDDGTFFPENFPVFLKPEWSENARGIYRADDPGSLARLRQETRSARVPYLVQECAPETREFEIFYLCHPDDNRRYSVFSVTEVVNTRETNPVNGIHNPDTRYHDITEKFSEDQKQTLFELIGQIGRFSISRICVRANSIDELLAENFHVIELNLFTPMPIHMLDRKFSRVNLWKMISSYMMTLARVTRHRDKNRVEQPVYTGTMLYNRESALANFVRGLV
jgi:hypothetical protein